MSGVAFHDTNGDGARDPGEVGLEGAVLTLKQGGIERYATTSGANGGFTFSAVIPGQYSLVERVPPPSYLLNPNPVILVVNPGQALTGVEIPHQLAPTPTPTHTLTPTPTFTPTPTTTIPGSIGGRVWYDADADGQQDMHETGLSGVKISLLTGGTKAGETTTRGDGSYEFTMLLPGRRYVVQEVDPAWIRFSSTSNAVNLLLANGEDAIDP